MYSRREFGMLAAAAVARTESKVAGVMIGAQSYSFRDRPLDRAIQAMQEIGLTYVELWQGHVEPRLGAGQEGREKLRQWRTSVSLDEFKKVRAKLDQAGLKLYAYNYSFRDDFSDAEIARGFDMAKALGVKYLTASSNVSTARRVNPYAVKAKVMVGMHNHSAIKPNEFARPEDFDDARRGMSKYIAVNLDVGHFWGAGFDPVAYLEKNHAYIVTLHMKDKTKGKDQNMPFGQGDTPLKAVMQSLKTKKYKIPAMIEYEYKGADTVAEVKKCYEYLRQLVGS